MQASAIKGRCLLYVSGVMPKTAEIVVKSVYNVRNLQTFFRKSVV